MSFLEWVYSYTHAFPRTIFMEPRKLSEQRNTKVKKKTTDEEDPPADFITKSLSQVFSVNFKESCSVDIREESKSLKQIPRKQYIQYHNYLFGNYV